MPTKTDRILSYLPGTFLALPRPTALYSVADAFGNELLQAENTLVAVMRSHWVDSADQGEEIIDDLARIASLYGLAPRDDETVEDFRAHLKRYVRTFLDGTPTVQGILQLTAEALALLIADSYEQMDAWWTRSQPEAALVSTEPEGADAADLLFLPTALTARGKASEPARISGTADLSGGLDLRAASKLALKIDAAAPIVLDLGSLLSNPGAAALADIVTAINTKLAAQVAAASADGKRLVLSSSSAGPASTVEVQDIDGDVAPVLLGLGPRTYTGSVAVSAQAVSTIDLAGGVDLSDRRYLRLLIDGTDLAEIDCSGAAPTTTKLSEIVTAINTALGLTVASQDGYFLTLTSPTTGFSSVIQFQSPAGQDAKPTLFGPVNGIYTGKSAQPAVVIGIADLSHGIDLSQKFNIEFALDGGAHIVVNCAGANPASTGTDDIVTAINKAAGLKIASQNGQFITLTSPTQGPASSIQFFAPAGADATFEIFGLAPRKVSGQAASAATLTGLAVPPGTLDLAAQHLLQVSMDGGPPTIVDFWKGNASLRAVTLGDIASSVNTAAGVGVASHDAQHLVLTSTVVGASSSVAVVPLERKIRRRFVTRAFVTDEASQITLGIFQQQARGAAASPARVEGTVELSRGVDLRDDPFLQLSIDGGPAKIIDCSVGVPRPRLALPEEVVTAIDTQIDPSGHSAVVATDGHHLFFTSPVVGAGSSIEFQPVLGLDALAVLGLQPTTVFGHDATRVVFVSTVDLSAGLDLSAASKVKLAIDGAAPVEIDCAGPDAAHTTLSQIVTRINTPLNTSIAAPVGKTIVLTSPGTGANSKIEFLAPSSNDATQMIFGVGFRTYQGDAARAAQVTGSEIKAAGTAVDMHQAKFLRVGLDGGAIQAIDCSSGAADPAKVTLPEIITAINKAANQAIASSPDGKRLILTGPTAAASGKLTLDTFSSNGAFVRLMGNADQVTRGTDPAPATIVGTVDLLAGVNLDERRTLRLAVDGARPLDIDISGAQPSKTFLDEIVAKINAVAPGVASGNANDRLVLASPTQGEESSLEVLPIRVLEVLEFPPADVKQGFSFKPGDKFTINNHGAADSELTIEIKAPQGVAGAELVDRSTGARVRVLDAVPAGGLLKIWNDGSAGLRAAIVTATGNTFNVAAANILAGPLGSQAAVPYTGAWHLSGGLPDSRAALQLNNPQATSLTVVRARRRGLHGSSITVAVAAAALPPLPAVTADGSQARLVGRLRFNSGAYKLVDGNNAVRVWLRAGAGVAFGPQVDQVVLVQGNLFPGEGTAPVMVVDSVATLFDVTIQGTADDGSAVVENYPGCSIGGGTSDPQSLVVQVFSKASQLVVAEELAKAVALKLPRGRSEWSFLAADGARFDHAHFNHADFAGGTCLEQGVFDVSRFAYLPPESEAAVFAGAVTDPPVQVTLRWRTYRPGAFAVNLPADLPENFGARFGQARFGRSGDAPEIFGNVVTEPQDDKDYITKRINETSSTNAKSTLVKATRVDLVPLGWDPMPMPFHHPRARPLTGGTDNDAAAIYLSEPGVPGFIELTALAPGKWGNTIEVTARKASPGRFDVTIGYQAARFENARQTAFAGRILAPGEDPLPALTDEILKPRPVGVVQGKAAGVLVHVTRDGTQGQE